MLKYIIDGNMRQESQLVRIVRHFVLFKIKSSLIITIFQELYTGKYSKRLKLNSLLMCIASLFEHLLPPTYLAAK